MAGTPPLRLVYVSVSCLTCGQKRVVMRGKGVGKAERVEMDEWARRHAEKPGHEVHYREIRRRTFNHTPMFACNGIYPGSSNDHIAILQSGAILRFEGQYQTSDQPFTVKTPETISIDGSRPISQTNLSKTQGGKLPPRG